MGLIANTWRRLWSLVVLGITLWHLCAPAVADVLADAETLIRGGRGAEAFRLLQPLEVDRAGDARFDHLLGVAALAAGEAARASLALERAVLVQPQWAEARVDLGRAYYALGDLDRAKNEFEVAAAHHPPPAARATIEHYLAAIEERQQSGARRFAAYLETSIGRDSNINAATANDTVFIPLFGAPTTLDPSDVRQGDAYAGLGAGVQVIRPLPGSVAILAGGDARWRRHRDADSFDTDLYNLRLGSVFGPSTNNARVVLNSQRYKREDGQSYDLHGGQTEWQRALGARKRLQIFGQYSEVRYGSAPLRPNDFNQAVLGAALVQQRSSRGMLAGALYVGVEEAIAGRTDGDKRLAGMRGGWQWGWGETAEGYLVIGLQAGNYQTENPLFLTTRRDRVASLSTGISLGLGGGWTLRPQATYFRQKSNIVLNQYDRVDVTLTLRYNLP